MAQWKQIGGGLAAAALVLTGSYFGFDLGETDNSGAPDDATPAATTAPPSRSLAATPTTQSSKAPTPGPSSHGSRKKERHQRDICHVDTLPQEADAVIDRILSDQDHLYAGHDGKHFGNYEGVLPREKSSYYREYTVTTPGINHRGARRIVVGGGSETDPDVWYYTDDHFESFCVIPDAED